MVGRRQCFALAFVLVFAVAILNSLWKPHPGQRAEEDIHRTAREASAQLQRHQPYRRHKSFLESPVPSEPIQPSSSDDEDPTEVNADLDTMTFRARGLSAAVATCDCPNVDAGSDHIGFSGPPLQMLSVPRIVHFVWVSCIREDPPSSASGAECPALGLMHFAAIKAALINIRPDRILVHVFPPPYPRDPWVKRIKALPRVELHVTHETTTIFGRKLATHPHQADVIRLAALIQHGGISLDMDILALKSFDKILTNRNLQVLLGTIMSKEGTITGLGNGVIIAKPGACFLRRWYLHWANFSGDWASHTVHLTWQMYQGTIKDGCRDQLAVVPSHWFRYPASENCHLVRGRNVSFVLDPSLLSERLTLNLYANCPTADKADGSIWQITERTIDSDSLFHRTLRSILDAPIPEPLRVLPPDLHEAAIAAAIRNQQTEPDDVADMKRVVKELEGVCQLRFPGSARPLRDLVALRARSAVARRHSPIATKYSIGDLVKGMTRDGVFSLEASCSLVKRLLCGEMMGGSFPDTVTHQANREFLDLMRRTGDWRIALNGSALMGSILGLDDFMPLIAATEGATLFGPYSDKLLQGMVDRMRSEGAVEFPRLLSASVMKGIVEGLEDKLFVERKNPEDWTMRGITRFGELPANKRGTYWLFAQDDALAIPEIQRLATDPLVLSLVQEYLQAPPFLNKIDVWVTVPSPGGSPDSASFREWHSDFNCLNSIKLFVLLSNVTEKCGPHVFVKGSHRLIPSFDASDDDQAAQVFRDQAVPETTILSTFGGRDTWRYLTGVAGTVVLEDTHVLHKGTPVVEGHHRVMMQIEYAASQFGGKDRYGRLYSPLGTTRGVPAALAPVEELYPRLFQRVRMGRVDTPMRAQNVSNTEWCNHAF